MGEKSEEEKRRRKRLTKNINILSLLCIFNSNRYTDNTKAVSRASRFSRIADVNCSSGAIDGLPDRDTIDAGELHIFIVIYIQYLIEWLKISSMNTQFSSIVQWWLYMSCSMLRLFGFIAISS